MAFKTREERYVEWLGRTERDLADIGIYLVEITEFDVFRSIMREQFGYTDRQIEALWEYSVWHEDRLKALGIRMVTYRYEVGPRAGQFETRWVIRGYPGLWGFQRMKEIAVELGLEVY